MTYTFKLSRRLAGLRDAAVIAASLFTLSCSDGPSGPATTPPGTDPTSVVITPDAISVGANQTVQFQAATDTSSALSFSLGNGNGRGRRKVVSVALNPVSSSVIPGGSQSFSATATLSDGSIVQPSLTWTATGGTVDTSGKYTAGMVTGNYRVAAMTWNGVADTAAVTITAIAPILVQMVLSPATISLATGGSQQFTVTGKSADGATVSVNPTYTATGGTISSSGLYTSGQTAGTFRVIATDQTTGVADTSAVTITAPPVTLQAVVLSPATASLTAGATQQFTASGKMSDGSTSSVTVTWSASGGTISSAGSYTAGQTAGTFRVIATQSGGTLADTATVTITAPSPAPTSGTTYFLADAENGTMVPPWESWGVGSTGGNPAPVISTQQHKNGGHSYRFEKNVAGIQGSSWVMTGNPQVRMCANGRYCTGYYSFWTYIESGFTEPTWNMTLGWMTGESGQPDPIGDIGLEIYNGQLQLIYYPKNCTDGHWYTCPNNPGYAMAYGSYHMTSSSPAGIVPHPRNQWVHVSVYYKMAKQPDGQVTIWQDGVKIMELTGLNTIDGWLRFNNTAGNLVLQHNIYEGASSDVPKVRYTDDFKVTNYQTSPTRP